MDILISSAVVVAIVGVRVWAQLSFADFVGRLPAEHKERWRRAMARADA